MKTHQKYGTNRRKRNSKNEYGQNDLVHYLKCNIIAIIFLKKLTTSKENIVDGEY